MEHREIQSAGVTGVSEVREMKKTQKKGGRINQDISLRVHQNRTVKLFKTMRILLKKLKARHLTVNEKLLKKVLKLRKWMEMFDQIIKKL